jgi:hypothetical protein
MVQVVGGQGFFRKWPYTLRRTVALVLKYSAADRTERDDAA